MRLLLDAAQNRAHADWLRETPGGYEWWYFDACSDDGAWTFAAVWFVGNPFSPYYRLSALRRPADPYSHNAVFFALYKDARLYAYHFTRFPQEQVCASQTLPLALRFGPNCVTQSAPGVYHLSLRDENANCRTLRAEFVFTGPPLLPHGEQNDGSEDTPHFWLPAAPACRVTGTVALAEKQNSGTEVVRFNGPGYHDHNWGALPFAVSDWHWARASLGTGHAVMLYALDSSASTGRLLHCQQGQITVQKAQIRRERVRVNGFGMAYATRVIAQSDDARAVFHFGRRLDSAPFYVRALVRASVTRAGETQTGSGLGEYFRPAGLAGRLAASATKARIVDTCPADAHQP